MHMSGRIGLPTASINRSLSGVLLAAVESCALSSLELLVDGNKLR